ncbi:hypothetical protein QFZ34_001171 [Phyllobacterium ifriqiyense]|uniref:Uncharacterized protein n=1 Tax=Phyllobacterium ifriqiyense TaxID=314238 RepID=A0ABU0S5I5_9HYPH|nr:hypothetical protein [Phyllobacterium ifriqiyense]
MDPEDKPYLSRTWPYLLAIVIMAAVSIALGRHCSVEHAPGYRVSSGQL